VPDLAEAKVRVLVMLAHNADGPALKKAGYAAAALVKVLGLHDRVALGYDAEIKLDEREWDDFTTDRRAAVLMHELRHLELVQKEVEGGRLVLQRDDVGRPKLKLREGDIYAGDGFTDVIEEFGEEALEAENYERAHGQVVAALGSRAGAA
jgi:hypothetical protein